MIDRKALLDDCKGLMRTLEADLIARSHGADALPEAVETLKEEFAKATEAKRTAQNFEDWRTDYATQQAAAWVLSTVFVRFLEDNSLIDPPQLAGPGERLKRARDEHQMYFTAERASETDREYLLHVFTAVGKLPGGREIFGKYNPVFEMPHWLSGDAAGEILTFFQKIDANTGALVHDFTDPEWDTRFLGDLYQDLSEAARKKYALLQTPEFVEEFILDRTLDPALDEFGLDAPPVKNADGDPVTEGGFRMIDPACGSGHFLLGAFRRILDRWQRKEPGTNVRELVQRTLNSVNGVDINPYASAIARFRLLIAALQACGIGRLQDAPAFHFHLAAGDSLLHGAPGAEQQLFAFDPLAHHYQNEDIDALRKILRPGTFHAVVANPPYITPKDRLLNQAYRERYSACHMKYALTVPFMERIFGLAVQDGFTGQITSNSFMKREFGKKLIESFFPSIDLTHMIDMGGAYIPGHGTPTVLLFGRQRKPVAGTVRAVMGIKGEPQTPEDPARGLVWSAILDQLDRPGSEGEFISVEDSPRENFHEHPWSIGGGGSAELKKLIECAASDKLGKLAESLGIMCFTLEDEVYFGSLATFARKAIENDFIVTVISGEGIKDWRAETTQQAIFPYDNRFEAREEAHSSRWISFLWRYRSNLSSSVMFGGKTKIEAGLHWYEYGRLTTSKCGRKFSLAFAEVSTHNHFTLDRNGALFTRSANVIQLEEKESETTHIQILGLLNCSVACFWLKQVAHNKGSTVDDAGARQRTAAFEDFYQVNSSKLAPFPLPKVRPERLAKELDRLACDAELRRAAKAMFEWERALRMPLQELLRDFAQAQAILRTCMISLQEELDWQCYRLYGLLDDVNLEWPEVAIDTLPEINLGERAFEIVLARKLASGDVSTTWFERHGSTPITEVPTHWPEAYRALVQRRIDCIESDKNIGLIERPEYKRRWNTESWASQQARALRGWLLDRLEHYFDFDGRMNDDGTPTAELAVALCSTAQLADIARQDPAFQAAGALYTNDPAFDVAALVADLVASESVPHLPVLRYKPAGRRKREAWEQTWALQRKEDAIDARTALPKDDAQYLSGEAAKALKKAEIGDIPVPPKYGSSDFIKSSYWKLRGKLDVPKERWVSFPHGEGQDGTLMVAWAGYDHLQLAQCISAHYVDVQERLGGRDDPRLVPLLASLIELLPWLKQWHNAIDPEFNMAMGDYFEGFLQEEARGLSMTPDEIRAWQPPETARRRAKRKSTATTD